MRLKINFDFEYSPVVLDKLAFPFDSPTFSQFWQEEGRITVSRAKQVRT